MSLERQLDALAAETPGVVAIAARDLAAGREYHRLADERLPSASVIKVAILVELLGRTAEGGLDLAERRALTEADKVPGSGVLPQLGAGLELTLLDLAHLMITVSDNTASNMLIDRLGCEAVNARLERLGLRRTRLGRKFYDFAARDRGLDNWLTAGEMADLLTGLEQRTALPPESCDLALAIMRQQQFDNRLPKLLPPDTPVANKTGSITGVCHDAGIIYSPAGPLVVVVLTQGLPDDALAEGVIRRAGRLVYDAWGA
jgi:beta-lactamase class A